MRKLRLLFDIVTNWYSNDCVQDIETIRSLLQVCVPLWPNLKISYESQAQFLKMMLFLSEDSLPFCKLMATSVRIRSGAGATNLLEMIVEFCVAETGKAKTAQTNLSALEMGLRIVSNCCSCIEGRLLIGKVSGKSENRSFCSLLLTDLVIRR